jgi:hypothetical protein
MAEEPEAERGPVSGRGIVAVATAVLISVGLPVLVSAETVEAGTVGGSVSEAGARINWE